MNEQTLVATDGLTKLFRLRGGVLSRSKSMVHAVEDVSLSIARGETLGLVGESGSGKSTLGRCVIRLMSPTSGSVFFDGQELGAAGGGDLGRLRRRMQIVFQDPFSSLDPRMRVGAIVAEGIQGREFNREQKRRRVIEQLDLVSMPARSIDRYPHEFSGGQRQRIGIARALAVGPEFIVLDEPVSALDVSVQSQILNLLTDLQARLHLTYLFISHDLSVVRHVADRTAVLYLGRVVELAPTARLFSSPRHPYTDALISAVPTLDGPRRARAVLSGEIPSAVDLPRHCAFAPRCPRVLDQCWGAVPELKDAGDAAFEHRVACVNPVPGGMRSSEASAPTE